MEQVVSSKIKNAKILNIILGSSLLGIGIYVSYTFIAFILGQIEIPTGVENFIFGSLAITITLIGMKILLRLDRTPFPKTIPTLAKDQ